MKFYILFAQVLLLTACQLNVIQTNSSYINPDPQSTITITQSLQVYPNSARAFLQNGEVISQEKLNLYHVNCEVEINTVAETRQIIKPGEYRIITTTQEESPIVKRQSVLVASLKYASSTPPDIKRYIRFHLSAQKSDSETQVRSLICRGVQAAHNEAELPTLEQMQSAVGNYIHINI